MSKHQIIQYHNILMYYTHYSSYCIMIWFDEAYYRTRVGSAYLQSMDCQREPQSKHPTGENPGIYIAGVPFLVLFKKPDRNTFLRHEIILLSQPGHCVVFMCYGGLHASNNCKIKESSEVLLLVYI